MNRTGGNQGIGYSFRVLLFSVFTAGIFCSCNMANNMNVKPSDINRSEDSVIVGRVKTKLGWPPSCPRINYAPSFRLYNTTDKSEETLYLYGEMSFDKNWAGLDEGYGKIILRKSTPGDYLFLICGTAQCIPLAKFTVPKGKLVHIGTAEFDRYCGATNAAENDAKRLLFTYPLQPNIGLYISNATIANEYDKTMRLLKNHYPQIHEMYKNDTLNVPQ
jgi:hypothetical protein